MRLLFVTMIAAVTFARPSMAIAAQQEFKAALDAPFKDAKVSGVLYVPPQIRSIQSVVVVLRWGMSDRIAADSRWRDMVASVHAGLLLLTVEGMTEGEIPVAQQVIRNAAAGGGDGLLALLRRLATESGHQELASVPLLLWGFSASGSFAITFAMLHPERTIAFVRYDSHLRDLPMDIKALGDMPALLLAGGNDQVAGAEDAEHLWQKGRADGAPWTFGVEPGQGHGEGLERATRFMLSWISSVMRQRVAAGKLRKVDLTTSWWGNNDTHTVAHQAPAAGDILRTSWLPDEETARLWQDVTRAPK